MLLGDSVSPWIMSRRVIVQWRTGRRCRSHKNLGTSFCRAEHWETGQWSFVPWCEQRSSIVRGEWQGITWATLGNHDGDGSKNSSLERARVYSFCYVCCALAILSAWYVMKCSLFYQRKLERDFLKGRKNFETQGDAYLCDATSKASPSCRHIARRWLTLNGAWLLAFFDATGHAYFTDAIGAKKGNMKIKCESFFWLEKNKVVKWQATA